jgi:MFS family permease
MAALYDSILIDLQFSTEQLGGITTARALLQAVSTPLWGYLTDRFSRKLIPVIGFDCDYNSLDFLFVSL